MSRQEVRNHYEERRQADIKRHDEDKPWHADDIEAALQAVGIEPKYLLEYLDWLRSDPS